MKTQSKVLEVIREHYARSAIAHIFLASGNIHDFQPESEGAYLKLGSLLEHTLQRDFGCVLSYDRNTWNCAPDSSRSKIVTALGGGQQQRNSTDLASMIGDAGSSSDSVLPVVPAAALEHVEQVFYTLRNGGEDSCAVILNYCESYLAAPGWGANANVDALVVRLLRWARDPIVRNGDHLIVLLCSDYSALHPALKDPDNSIEKLTVSYPNHQERAAFIKSWINQTLKSYPEDSSYTAGKKILSKLNVEELSKATAGLNFVAVEDVLMRALTSSDMTYEFVKERKDSIVRHSAAGLLEVMEPEWGWEFIAGLDHVKAALDEDLVKPMKAGDFDRVVKGVLMCGAPGTGKSVAAEAVAKDAGVVMVKMSMGKIFNMYVGQSEHNMDKALSIIQALAPCIVFMDEIDQAGHTRGEFDGTSGTNKRVFQRLLEFMGDDALRGRVAFLAATNRPDLIDPAMKRAGRFDVKVVFPPPDRAGRADILKAQARKYGVDTSDSKINSACAAVSKKTEGWVGADLLMLVLKAKRLATSAKGFAEALSKASEIIVPSISPTDIQFMTGLGLAEVNDLSTLPEWMLKVRQQYIEKAEKRREVKSATGFRSVKRRTFDDSSEAED